MLCYIAVDNQNKWVPRKTTFQGMILFLNSVCVEVSVFLDTGLSVNSETEKHLVTNYFLNANHRVWGAHPCLKYFSTFVKLRVYFLEEYFLSYDEDYFSSSSDLVQMEMLESSDLFDIHIINLRDTTF